jgi:hypothetical protein
LVPSGNAARRGESKHSCPPFAAGRPVAAHHASRITHHFPMSKNVGSNAKPKLGKPFEPSKLKWRAQKFFGLIYLNLA